MATKKEPNKEPKKSKYLRDPNEKRSKYLRDDKEKKSKYIRGENEVKEHHFILAKNIRNNEPEEDSIDIIDKLLETDERKDKALDPQVMDMLLDGISAKEENNIPGDLGIDNIENTEIVENIGDIENAKSSESSKMELNEVGVEVEELENLLSDGFAAYPANDDIESDKKVKTDDKHKGNNSSIFKHSGLLKDTTVARVTSREETKERMVIRMAITTFVMTGIAILLQLGRFTLPIFPSLTGVELSVFPELFVSLAYGPVLGLAVVIVKDVIHFIMQMNDYVSSISNFVLDSVFLIVVSLFYSRKMFFLPSDSSRSSGRRLSRRKRILLGGFVGSTITAFVSFFLYRYVSYPMLLSQYSDAGLTEFFIVNNYQNALNRLYLNFPEILSQSAKEIENLTQAILIYNVPITFFKFFLVTLVSALVYVIVSPYLHFRKK
jgi:riboflavin transporter FmnP